MFSCVNHDFAVTLREGGGGGRGEDVFNRALAETVFALFLFLPLFFFVLNFYGVEIDLINPK